MGNKTGKLSPRKIEDLQKHVDVNFTREEIHEWFKEFRGNLAPGEETMTRADFLAVYNKLFIGDAADFAEQVFRTFDKNNDQKVDFREFLVGLCISGSSDPGVKMKWAFQMYDLDGDGFISLDEMVHIFKAISKMTQSKLHEDYPDPEGLADKMFKILDKNEDNLISWKEFEEGVEKETMVIDILQCNPDPEDELDFNIQDLATQDGTE